MFREWREQSEKERAEREAKEKAERETREAKEKAERAEEEKKWAREQKRLDRELAKHGDRIGDLVCAMIEAGLVRKFNKLGYQILTQSRRGMYYTYNPQGVKNENSISGDIDFFMEGIEADILVEVKTKAKQRDITKHIERLEKYRKVCDIGGNAHRKVVGAIGGGIIPDDVEKFALKKGLFVIKQSGERVKLLQPEGGPKVW
jgi:hypothetical protein